MDKYIVPSWPAPRNIRAICTTRLSGFSLPPYDQFNLASHVGDDFDSVARNRTLLCKELALPCEPNWLNQVHGNEIVNIDQISSKISTADGAITSQKDRICVVLTADCLPILITSKDGKQVAAIHCGWRGLAQGMIANSLKYFKTTPNNIMAWLGPAIGPQAFVVGRDVYDCFVDKDPQTQQAFALHHNEKWLADIYQLAHLQLQQFGLTDIYGGNFCTYTAADRFYSYRRDGGTTGRMASLIWITRS